MQRYSRKREAILAAVRSVKTHPSAEWVYLRLKETYPDLSLGTVYRNLSGFRDEGKVITVAVVDGQERFDGNTADHPHFICDRCGAVTDVPLSWIPACADPGEGFVVLRYELTLRGLCPECAKSGSRTALSIEDDSKT